MHSKPPRNGIEPVRVPISTSDGGTSGGAVFGYILIGAVILVIIGSLCG
jgi:hypothetical protein